jgi:ribosomal protein L40E
MSFHVFFSFSRGLSGPITAPIGTLARIIQHVEEVERTLRLERTQFQDNPVHWEWRGWPPTDLDDKILCQTVEDHNRWVERLYDRIADWAKKPVEDGEMISPEDAKTFWHGLQRLEVPVIRWTGDYYRARMDTIYEVMRGRSQEGITFGEKALTPKQAGAVIRLFEGYLDPQDLRLEVPKGCDRLASSYWGEYDWCERCGAVLPDYSENCRKRGCPVQSEWCEEDRPSWFKPAKGGTA